MTPAGAEMELDAPIADLLIGRGIAREAQASAQPQVLTKAQQKRIRKQLRNANR